MITIWIMIPEGFVSIVEKVIDQDNDTLTIRARDARSLEAFVNLIWDDTYEAEFDMDTDYPFRYVMPRSVVVSTVAALADDIDYTNFKNEAHERRGSAYAGFLSSVWTAGLSLTPNAVRKQVDAKWRKMDAEWERSRRKK